MRQVSDFVRDMRERGRTDAQIMGIAQCTHWVSRAGDIREYLGANKAPKPAKKTK